MNGLTTLMKNRFISKLFPILLFIISILFMTGCKTETPNEHISNEIKLDVSGCTIINDNDTHGGIHGDGERMISLDCSNTNILERVNKWNRLPLSDNLGIVMYSGEKNGEIYGYDLAKDNNIPKIDNGYYYFVDRYTKYYKDYEDIYSDYKLLDRTSMNFIVAMYDLDTNYLYYYEYDS